MDPAAWKKYGKIDPEFETLITKIPTPKSFADYDSAPQLRENTFTQFMGYLAAGIISPHDWSGCHKDEIQIPVRDGTKIRAIVYRPGGEEKGAGPLFVYYHGGGWTFGMPEAVENYATPLVKELGITVVSVSYRLAPEHVFPTAAYDAIDSLTWCFNNASFLHADPSKGFIIGGTSAGGNITTVASHAAEVREKLTGVVLACPALLHHEAVPAKWRDAYGSWEEQKDAAVLDQKGMEWFYDNYKPDPKSELASPLLYENHGEQPPTYFQIMGMDPLRDEQFIYEHVLREQGVKTKVTVYAGIPHGATELLPMLSHAKKAVSDYTEGVQWILKQGTK